MGDYAYPNDANLSAVLTQQGMIPVRATTEMNGGKLTSPDVNQIERRGSVGAKAMKFAGPYVPGKPLVQSTRMQEEARMEGNNAVTSAALLAPSAMSALFAPSTEASSFQAMERADMPPVRVLSTLLGLHPEGRTTFNGKTYTLDELLQRSDDTYEQVQESIVEVSRPLQTSSLFYNEVNRPHQPSSSFLVDGFRRVQTVASPRDMTPPRNATPRRLSSTRDVTPVRYVSPRRAAASDGGLSTAALTATFQGVPSPSQQIVQVLPPITISQSPVAVSRVTGSYTAPPIPMGVIPAQQPVIEVLPPYIRPVGLNSTGSFIRSTGSYVPPTSYVPPQSTSLPGSYVPVPPQMPAVASASIRPGSILQPSPSMMVVQPPAASLIMQQPSSSTIVHPPVAGMVRQPGSLVVSQPSFTTGPSFTAAPPLLVQNSMVGIHPLQQGPSMGSQRPIGPPIAIPPEQEKGKLNLTAGVPDIASVEKQKQAYNARLDNQAKCEEELLKMKQQQEKVLIYQAAEARKRQAILAIDQEAKQQELELDQQCNAQRMGMQQELQSWKLLLQQQAASAILDYQARKSQEELLIAKYEANQAQHISAQKRRSAEGALPTE